MPRNRSVRLAALGATAQRPASSSFGSRAGASVRRRAVVIALVATSLMLMTGYFREAENGPLHDLQGTAAQLLEPFEVGAGRLVRPFRDAWGWFDDLRDAKAENERLRRELAALRTRAITARLETQPAGRLSRIETAAAPKFNDFRLLRAEVVLFFDDQYRREVVVTAGAKNGVRRYDPVVSTRDGVLVGHVSKVGRSTALVTLITDTESAVASYDLETDARGIVRGRGPGASTLILDRVQKEEVVARGDDIVTSGRLSGERFASFYPRGIAIGRVESVDQSDTHNFKLVLVKPFAELSDPDSVVILRRKKSLPAVP